MRKIVLDSKTAMIGGVVGAVIGVVTGFMMGLFS